MTVVADTRTLRAPREPTAWGRLKADRNWLGFGTGAWDRERRPSYVRLDRVIEVGEHEIRREGAVLDEARFDRVAGELRSRYGWT